MGELKNKKLTLDEICSDLRSMIESAYLSGVTLSEAEKLAAKTLTVRMELTDRIKTLDLDSRMKKHGVKAVRAAAYLEEISKHDKKPTETMLESIVNLSDLVKAEEREHAEAETEKDRLEAYSDIFKDAHIFFRGVAKGTFE